MTEEFSYRKIIDSMFDGVYIVNPERQIIFWNKAAERISGYPAERMLGSYCYDNILDHVTEGGRQLCFDGCPLHATIANGQPCEAEVFLRHAEGYRIPVLVRTAPLQDEDGKIVGAVEIFSDNSQLFSSRNRVRKLEETANLDPLTAINNRRRMESRLQYALAEFRRHRVPFGVLFLDIDYFKRINDAYGHEIGDKALQMVAKTLQKNVRTEDVVARWGGEEFIILLSNVDLDGLRAVAEKLCAIVKTSAFRVDSHLLQVTVSIGGALIQPGEDTASLLRRADQHLYRSKQTGRDRVTCN